MRSNHETDKVTDTLRRLRAGARAAVLAASMTAVLGVATADAQSILNLLANSLNSELPRAFGNHTKLVRVTAQGNTLGALFEVGPESPLAKKIDVKTEAAKLCKAEIFRQLIQGTGVKIRVTYVRPDRTALGGFMIDRSICRS